MNSELFTGVGGKTIIPPRSHIYSWASDISVNERMLGIV